MNGDDSNGNGLHARPVAMPQEQHDHAAHTVEIKKALKPQYPLTSWQDTPQNTVCVAFLLGCVFTIALTLALTGSSAAGADGYGRRTLVQALTSPRLGAYVTVIVTFHMLEYLTTAIWNPARITIRSYLLDDRNHATAHVFALLEYVLEEMYLPEKWLAYKRSPYLALAGLAITLSAQYLRSLAMITAAANFSHLIVYTKAPEHSLVRTGIYGWSRHPSYVAFYYWALGTQVFIGNPASFLAFNVVLYRFFSHRIRVEEYYLVKFFGKDYEKYQKEVPARIPFIR